MAVKSVAINGAELAYEIAGPEHAPLIITLHGGRGMGDSSNLTCIIGHKLMMVDRRPQVGLRSVQSSERSLSYLVV